jgi:hypothetical protein
VSGSTQVPDERATAFAYGTVTRYGRPFQGCSACRSLVHSLPSKGAWSYNPARTSPGGLGYGPVRSPLLRPSRLLSFPRGTEMFQFPPFAPAAYGLGGWSFGYPGLNARLTAPPGLSQSSTPFIACRRQDIPHTPLVAWPRRPCPRKCGNREGTAAPPAR